MELSPAGACNGSGDAPFPALLEDISRSLTAQVSLAGNCLAFHPQPSASYRLAAEQAVSRLRSAVMAFGTDMTWASRQANGLAECTDATQDRPLGIEAFAAAQKRWLRLEALQDPGRQEAQAVGSILMVDSVEDLAFHEPTLAPLQEQPAGDAPLELDARGSVVTQESAVSQQSEAHGTEREVSAVWRPKNHHAAEDVKNSCSISLSDSEDFKPKLSAGENDEAPDTWLVQGFLNPNWIGRLTWDFGVVAIVLVDAMVLPFQIAYKHGTENDLFDVLWLWITTAFFAVDIVMNCFTAYTATDRDVYEDRGKLVTQWSRIMKNYLWGWFSIDFVSTVPWSKLAEVIAGADSVGSNSAQVAKLTKVVKFVRFLRLMRMLRLAKLGAIWERIETKMGSLILLQVLALIRVLFIVISICHWNACIWWMIGQPRSLFTDLLTEQGLADWDESPHWTTVTRSMGADATFWSWDEKGTPEAYVFCFYWTLGVMRTMPSEVTPVNLAERIYVMLFMFFAVSAFAISVTLITQAFLKIGERKRVFNEDMAFARMHLRRIKASAHLQTNVKEFLVYLFNRRRIQAKELGLFGQLPQQLIKDMRYSSLKVHLQRLTQLKGFPKKMHYLLSEICEIRDLVPGEHLCRQGTVARAAWVLMSGHLRWQEPFGQPISADAVSVVDEECLLTQRPTHSRWTVLSTVCSEALYISKRKFLKILKPCGSDASLSPFRKAKEASAEAGVRLAHSACSKSWLSLNSDSDHSQITQLTRDSSPAASPRDRPEPQHTTDSCRISENHDSPSEANRMAVKLAHTAAVMST